MLLRSTILAVLAALTGSAAGASPAEEPASIAAASDLQFALAEVADRFQAEGHGRVRLTMGSSGNLARQIEQGAPFEMFFSADEQYVFRLAERGLTRDRGELHAIGRIAIVAPPHSELYRELVGDHGAHRAIELLRTAIRDGRVRRFAIAHPEHAPYGRAAMQALRHLGIWEAIQPALVRGENVSQAARFALTGDSYGGIVAYALLLAPTMKERARFALLPESWHEPLRQRMVLLRGASPTAERFYAYMQGAAAREIMERYGFVVPGD